MECPPAWIGLADQLAVLDLKYTHGHACMHGGSVSMRALSAIRAQRPGASSVRIGSHFDPGRISRHNSNLHKAESLPPRARLA